MPVLTETPAADFTRADFDRAWQLDTHVPRHTRVRPETAIVLQRNSPHDFQDRQIYVFVDGEPLGKIRYGHALNHPIEPGEHTVRVFNNHGAILHGGSSGRTRALAAFAAAGFGVGVVGDIFR